MDQIKVGRGSWLAGGLLLAAFLGGVVYGQAPGGQAPAGTAPGSAPAEPAKTPPDKVVLKVGDTSITAGDIDKAIQGLTPQAKRSLFVQNQGRRPIGDEYVLMLVLSEQALAHHLDSTPEFKEMVALNRIKILASQEYQEIAQKAAVTPQDVNKYYAAHPLEFDELKVVQVVVRKQPPGAKAGTPGFPAEEAKTRAEQIRKAFIAGDDPAKIADKYQVESLVRVDSQPFVVHHGTMRPDMEKAAFELKPGEVTEVFDLGQTLAFLKVVSHQTEDLKTVSPRIENNLRQQKINSSIDTLKKNAKAWMDDAYFASPIGGHPPLKPEATMEIPVNQ